MTSMQAQCRHIVGALFLSEVLWGRSCGPLSSPTPRTAHSRPDTVTAQGLTVESCSATVNGALMGRLLPSDPEAREVLRLEHTGQGGPIDPKMGGARIRADSSNAREVEG